MSGCGPRPSPPGQVERGTFFVERSQARIEYPCKLTRSIWRSWGICGNRFLSGAIPETMFLKYYQGTRRCNIRILYQ